MEPFFIELTTTNEGGEKNPESISTIRKTIQKGTLYKGKKIHYTTLNFTFHAVDERLLS